MTQVSFTVGVPQELAQQIAKAAESQGLKRNAWIRRALEAALDESYVSPPLKPGETLIGRVGEAQADLNRQREARAESRPDPKQIAEKLGLPTASQMAKRNVKPRPKQS